MIPTFFLTDQPIASRSIAELTGKPHGHVLRDIDVMLKALNVKPDGYVKHRLCTKNGQMFREFSLPRNLVLTLVCGYGPHRRKLIIDALLERLPT